MKLALTVCMLLFFTSYRSLGQVCNCNLEFTYIKDKIEKNYAGFNDKVNGKTKPAYNRYTKLAFEQSKLVTNPAYCTYLISDWLKFFRDGHIQIGRNRISKEEEGIWLKQRMQKIDHINLSKEHLAALKTAKGITGIYWDADSASSIAIIENRNSFRHYAGIVISSKQREWLPGQVIMELKSGKDTLKGILYDKYAIPTSISLKIGRNALGSWTREGVKQPAKEKVTEGTVASMVLSENTLYIRLSTFNQSNARNIDSLFKANNANLAKMPNLILDLRDNGGGSDFSYRSVTPYLYTNPVNNIGADVLSTDANIAGWLAIATTGGLPPDQQVFIRDVIKKMEQNKGKLVSFSDDRILTSDSIAAYPKKVVILMNKNCGSTTEEFLLFAKQSRKVTLMGEPTGGVLDYSNMRGANFSCMPYMLYWATSRSRRIDQGMAIDNIGIQPDKVLSPDQNWIDEAKNYAESKAR